MARSWIWVVVICSAPCFNVCVSESDENSIGQSDVGTRYRLEGKITVPSIADKEWTSLAKVLVDGGQFLGLVKPDGSFVISSIPSGSYVVEVTHPTYVFDPARVEISSKGKIRARSLNNVQPSAIHQLSYPLRFKARGQAQYFEKREQWRVTDFILSPMVLTMILPLGLMLILPKLINTHDPEIQREMQSSMNLLQPQQNMPDAAELLTKWLGSGSSSSNTKKKEIKHKSSKKQQ